MLYGRISQACEEVTLPFLPLQLSFPHSPSQSSIESLAQLLRSPAAARTQISIRLDKITFQEQEGDESDEIDESIIPLSLSVLNSNLVSLDVPTTNAEDTLFAACLLVPSVSNLVLRLEGVALDGELWDFGQESEDLKQQQSKIQLQCLVLHAPPGETPFCFTPPLLNLSSFDRLQHVVIQGPIIQDRDELDDIEQPLLLPPHTKVITFISRIMALVHTLVVFVPLPSFALSKGRKAPPLSHQVTIDPHLEGRQPTKWARPLKTYDRYEMMPVDAIPDANTVGFNLARHAVSSLLIWLQH